MLEGNGKKVITWSGDIDRNAMEQICWFLLRCKKEGKDAVLLLSSDGGSVECLAAILDTLIATKVHLTVIGRGKIASAAATLFCMGDRRILLPNSKILLHNVRYDLGTAKPLFMPDVKRVEKELEEYNDYNIDRLCEKTQLTREVYEEMCEKREDWILTLEEILKYGIVTEPYSEDWVDIVVEALNANAPKGS